MGTGFEIVLSAAVPGAAQLACQALDRIDELETQMTVYREDSELSRLNASAHLAEVPVESGLLGLLLRAQTLNRETSGAYDVASGALSQAWGFTFGPRRVPSAEELEDARSRTGMHLVRINDSAGTVRFLRQGVQINLGSIGKGYAIDQAVSVVRNHFWPTSALIHGGHSSLYALGSPPMTLGGRWTVSLRNPFEPEQPLGSLRLRDRAMGTSGTAFQKFEANGRLYGHILDPRTGEPPTNGPESVSVLARSAADADALSTAFSLIGLEATLDYLANKPDIAAIFVVQEPQRSTRRLISINLPEQEFAPDLACLVPVKNDGARRLRVYQIGSTQSSNSRRPSSSL